ncbi:MAG: gamma-glutamylcyclotransferase [Reichenbachiella sp.]
METKNLFIYGTLLSSQENEFSSFLKQNSRIVGPGLFQGQLYQIDWYPGVIKSSNSLDQVKGNVVQITGNASSIFSELDKYEGVSWPPKDSDEYSRQFVNISLNNRNIRSWIYLYQGRIDNAKRIISGDYNLYQKE